MRTLPVLSLVALALSCDPPVEEALPSVTPGAPFVGAAEGTLDLPVGTPLGGYTARCGCLIGYSRQDSRESPYTRSFVESTGVQMREQIKVVWLDNGDDHLVMAKTGVIYSHDRLVQAISDQLSEATGLDLTGKVTLTAGHSHHSYGPFSDDPNFYLGGDYFHAEIFERFAEQVTEVALEAYESRQAAAIGTSWEKDWDPDDAIYRDRRGVNNELTVWEDQETPGWGKDPWLNLIRLDATDGTPLAVIYTFGIHGITIGDDNSMISPDSSGALDVAIQEMFDTPVVAMHLQGAGGDASPAGRDRQYARLESLGALARERILPVWEATPTSSDPIRLETASRHIPQHHSQIRVTRNGTVDWHYTPLVEDSDPDDLIYDESGDLLSPIDEFNAPYGAVFCGQGGFDLPLGGMESRVFPYDQCMDVAQISQLLVPFFELEAVPPLPIRPSMKAGTTASRFGPIPTVIDGAPATAQELLVGWFPGESTAMYVEQWRRRAEAELGFPMALHVGYSQDHEGYLLIPEDWLMGGYEPDISIWGPLAAEHVMEGTLHMVEEVLGTDVHEDPDPWGTYAPTVYDPYTLPEHEPDLTPEAGTPITEPPDYLWLPEDLELQLETPAQVERVRGQVQLAWLGGDPAVDLPRVALERQGADGAWTPVESRSGRPITDTFQDILLAHTPDPLFPVEATQQHRWWAGWQAVGHEHDRAGVPAGTYRLRVSGQRFTGGTTTHPWPTEPYEVLGEPFEVVPAELDLRAVEGGLEVWLEAPEDGYRLIDLDGSSRGDNPVRGELTLRILAAEELVLTVTPTELRGSRSFVEVDLGAWSEVTVTDPYGNHGTLVRPD